MWNLRSSGVDPRLARQQQLQEASTKAEGKLRTANVLFSDLKQMLRFALARDIIDRNPLETVLERDVGGTAVERDRVLSQDELRTLAASCASAALNPRSVEAIWFTLATGVRAGELMGAIWSADNHRLDDLRAIADAGGVKLGVIDTEARTWHLYETKNQRDHTIHLSDFAMARVAKLRELRVVDEQGKPCPWVFPSAKADGPVCVKSFGKQLADRQRPADKRLSHRAKDTTALLLPGGRWTAHDLRRTAATLMAELGISGDVIDECLNHIIENKVRRVYIRNRREDAQAVAFDALGKLLGEIVGGRI